MTPCFADTFYFIALLNPHDEARSRALAIATDLRRPVVTTTWILTELADFLAATASRRLLAGLVERLRSEARTTIVPASDETFNLAVQFYDRRHDKEWSLTDCTSFVVMQDQGLTEALTGDHHFEQAGFVALLK